MPPRKGGKLWVPEPVPWEGVRLVHGGRVLRLVYITGDGQPADRADIWWSGRRLTVTLSRMRTTDSEKLALVYHCVEVPLSRDATDFVLVDGATAERASAKNSAYLSEERLRGTERTEDMVFEPRERLEPRETGD